MTKIKNLKFIKLCVKNKSRHNVSKGAYIFILYIY